MSARATGSAAFLVPHVSADVEWKASPLEGEVVALFDLYRDRLLRYLLTFGLAIPDSEEVIQEVFLSLFQHLSQDKSRQNLKGWLFRVAHNLALKRRSHVQRRLKMSGEIDLNHIEAIDPMPSPEDEVVNNQTRRRLFAVFQALPELDRRCLSLRAEGLRYREIAEVLKMSLGAVSISLVRSLERLSRAAER